MAKVEKKQKRRFFEYTPVTKRYAPSYFHRLFADIRYAVVQMFDEHCVFSIDIAGVIAEYLTSKNAVASTKFRQTFPEAFCQTNDNNIVRELVRQARELDQAYTRICAVSRHGIRRVRARLRTRLSKSRENIIQERAEISMLREANISKGLLVEFKTEGCYPRICPNCEGRFIKNADDGRYSCSRCGYQQQTMHTDRTMSRYSILKHVYRPKRVRVSKRSTPM